MTNQLKLILIFTVFLLSCLAAYAYTSSARNSLLKSRDQVADQRAKLERAYSEIDQKIAQLQDQKYSINRYLQDCDRTIREIDKTLSAQDQTYRGH